MQIAFKNNKTNEFITIHEVNELVCKLWNKIPNENSLVAIDKTLPDWYVVLCMTIRNASGLKPGNLSVVLSQVLKHLFGVNTSNDNDFESTYIPFFSLLDMFIENEISIVLID